MNFFKQNFKLASFLLPFILGINILSNFISQQLTSQLEFILRDTSTGGFNRQLWIYGGLSVLVALIFPILMSTLTLWGIKRVVQGHPMNLKDFFNKYFEQLTIECLRSWGDAMKKLFYFIIPGLNAFLYYSLTPFVVILSPDYEKGNLDVLKTSKIVFKRNFIKLFIILLFFGVVFPLFINTVFDGFYTISKTPLTALLLNFFESYFIILSTHLIFFVISDQPEFLPTSPIMVTSTN